MVRVRYAATARAYHVIAEIYQPVPCSVYKKIERQIFFDSFLPREAVRIDTKQPPVVTRAECSDKALHGLCGQAFALQQL